MKKKWTDSLLVLTCLAVMVSGIVLHLKRHGIVVEPRAAIKMAHWLTGAAMTVVFVAHYRACRRALSGMGRRYRFFPIVTRLLLWAFVAVALTGGVKLLSPVKIKDLGLVHYWCGIVMSVSALLHLIVGLPLLLKNLRR